MHFKSFLRLLVSILVILIFFFPIYFWIIISLKTDKDIYSINPKLFKFELDLYSYEQMFGISRLFNNENITFFGNDIYQIPRFVDTLIISFGSTILVIILSTISTYSLSRMNIKGKEIFLLILISTRIINTI